MNFGVISLSQLNKHSLDSLYFSQGHISPFTRFSILFLGSTEQYKAMKIGITFFGSKLDLLCISKVLTIFCVFSKIRWKKKRSRGHVAGSPSARPMALPAALSRVRRPEARSKSDRRFSRRGREAAA